MASLPFSAAPEFANMFAYYRRFPYYDELRPLDQRCAIGPTFRQWVEAHREQLQAKLESS
jgi:hypothetical protein